jgi:hypothetical protein
MPHAYCGFVNNGCCDASELAKPAFNPSAAPLPPPKPAIAYELGGRFRRLSAQVA